MDPDIPRLLDAYLYQREYVADGPMQPSTGQRALRVVQHSQPQAAEILNTGGRQFVAVRPGGIPLHYWQSSGYGGKPGTEGKWFPTPGYIRLPNGNEWIVKGHTPEILNSYGVKDLKEIGRWVNARFGDLRLEGENNGKPISREQIAENLKRFNELQQKTGIRRVMLNPDFDPVARSNFNKGYGENLPNNPKAAIEEFKARINNPDWKPAQRSAGGGGGMTGPGQIMRDITNPWKL